MDFEPRVRERILEDDLGWLDGGRKFRDPRRLHEMPLTTTEYADILQALFLDLIRPTSTPTLAVAINTFLSRNGRRLNREHSQRYQGRAAHGPHKQARNRFIEAAGLGGGR